MGVAKGQTRQRIVKEKVIYMNINECEILLKSSCLVSPFKIKASFFCSVGIPVCLLKVSTGLGPVFALICDQ